MRGLVFLLCVLGLSCASPAQTNQASWETLNHLKPGQSIQVVDTSSKKHSGTLLNVSDSAISLRVASGEQSLQKQDVRSVKLLNHSHRGRNALIGAAIGGGAGAGVGAAIGAATHQGCSSTNHLLPRHRQRRRIGRNLSSHRRPLRCNRRRDHRRLHPLTRHRLHHRLTLTRDNLPLVARPCRQLSAPRCLQSSRDTRNHALHILHEVCQLQTLTRIARRPRQVVPVKKASPDARIAAIM